MVEEVIISLVEIFLSIASFIVSLLSLPFSFLKSKKTSLIPKAILITGATSGIGESLALEYAAPGVFLALVGRKKDLLENVSKNCESLGATVEIGLVDVTNTKDLEAFILKVDASHKLDLVIANAGISASMLGDAPFEEKLAKVFDVNVTGVFNTVNPILQSYRERGAGQIAVVGSLSGFFDLPRSSAYGSSKAAIYSFCRSLRGLMKPYNVGVTVICPGFVQSNFTKFTHQQGRKTPFLISSEEAAKIIKTRLQHDPPVIAFPLVMYVLSYVLRVLPPSVTDLLFSVAGFTTKAVPPNRIG